MFLKVKFHIGILFLVLNLRTSMGQNPPVIPTFLNGDIVNHAIELKEGISLECDGRGEPVPKYKWFQNGKEVQPETEGSGQETTESIELKNNNQIITFLSVESHIHGFYHCEAENDHGTAVSEVIFVTNELPPNPNDNGWTVPEFVDGGPKPHLIPFEQSATLFCDAKGEPTPDIVWTKDGQLIDFRYELQNMGKIKLDSSTNSLTINSVKEDMVGTYACNATNLAGYVYKSVPLNILKQAPIIVEKPMSRNVSIGMKGIIRCSVEGYPKPTTSWKYNGVDVLTINAGKVVAELKTKYEIMPDGGLTINNIEKEDKGNYTCSASNSEGDNSETVQLGVVTQTTIENGPAGEQKKIIHETVRFDCSVLYDPTHDLTVIWKKDNNDVNEDDPRITVDRASVGNQALTITDLTYDDAGTYTCVARTVATGTDTASGALTVDGIIPTIEGSKELHQNVPEGEDIRVLCKYEGDPKPEQTWYKNQTRIVFDDGYWIENDRIYLDNDGSLVISDAKIDDDNGKYICKAQNKFGKATASAFVVVTKKTILNTEGKDIPFTAGTSVTFDCEAEVDPELEDGTTVEWFKDEVKIDFENVDKYEKEVCVDKEYDDGIDCSIVMANRIIVHDNNSIAIFESKDEDIGDYHCEVRTPVESPQKVYHSYYGPQNWTWLIILIAIIIAILVLILCILCIICCRKRATKAGTYDVHPDEEDGGRKKKNSKVNQSDIQYSIDDEIEGILPDKNGSSGKKPKKNPIFRPKSSKGTKNGTHVPSHANGTGRNNISGSENSLLEEDDWLRKGMDEDGSFREGKYAA